MRHSLEAHTTHGALVAKSTLMSCNVPQLMSAQNKFRPSGHTHPCQCQLSQSRSCARKMSYSPRGKESGNFPRPSKPRPRSSRKQLRTRLRNALCLMRLQHSWNSSGPAVFLVQVFGLKSVQFRTSVEPIYWRYSSRKLANMKSQQNSGTFSVPVWAYQGGVPDFGRQFWPPRFRGPKLATELGSLLKIERNGGTRFTSPVFGTPSRTSVADSWAPSEQLLLEQILGELLTQALA